MKHDTRGLYKNQYHLYYFTVQRRNI